MWSPDIRKTLLCVTAIGIGLRSHDALMRDLCEPNCVSTTTSASVWRSYHDLTAPRTRAQCNHRRPSTIRMRPYSDATTTLATTRCLSASAASIAHAHGVPTTILWQSLALCCIYGSIPWRARMCWTYLFFKCKCVVLYLENELWFHSSLNHYFSNELQC